MQIAQSHYYGLVNTRRGSVKALVGQLAPKRIIRYAFYLFVFCLPFEGAIGGLSHIGFILAGSTVCQPKLFLKPLPKAFWCFVIYLFVVAVLGLAMTLDNQQDSEYTSGLITQLFRLSQLLVFFFIAYTLMTFESIAKRSLLIFAFSCVLLAILQFAGVIATEDHGRVTVYDFNPNVTALLLSVGLIYFLGVLHGERDASMKLRLLVWLSSAVLLIPIVRTGSRGGAVALILAVIVLVVKPGSIPQKAKMAFMVVAVVAALGWATFQIEAVRNRWENTYYKGDVASRDILFPVAWQMFLERPITGWGPVNHYWEMNIRTADPDGGDPHNLYLWVLKETGLLGAFPLFVGLWLCWRSTWRARRSSHGTVALALLLLMLVQNLKGTYLFFKIFWFVLAYAAASGTYVIGRARVYSPSVRFRKTQRIAQFDKCPPVSRSRHLESHSLRQRDVLRNAKSENS
jgi:O-antigen ligase